MSGRPVISVRGLGKRYRLGESVSGKATLRDSLAFGAQRLFRRSTKDGRSESDFWALKDVSFDVNEGEVLGIIGANGAGKSTLLKILSQITEPSEGEIRVRGRVASLLEVGTGFHQELSGRENIFMNGAILGMSQAEIRRKFDAIVAFAGVERFLDTPVKRYSSGMFVRLAFAVAAHLEPEILIIDEVLAVGDTDFQHKCLGKMEDVSRAGRTVLFVSHQMAAVEALCSRGVFLRKGHVQVDGSTTEAVAAYNKIDAPLDDVDLTDHPDRVVHVDNILKRFQILDGDSVPVRSLVVGKPATFRVVVKPARPIVAPVIGLHFYSLLGQRVMTLHSGYQAPPISVLRPSEMTENGIVFECRCPTLQMSPGRYRVTLAIASSGRQVDRIESVATFDVASGDFYGTGRVPPVRDGVFWPVAEWSWHS